MKLGENANPVKETAAVPMNKWLVEPIMSLVICGEVRAQVLQDSYVTLTPVDFQ